ncbi:hypothetical protein BDA99DRAFT_562803 [Phascolomyces articulosus]|uniref:Uncharacterized protein n=1 Tax=Phascolomyces articulosus TaxID=60185 RepID=A0AAD5PAS4_9FUNG|nr:hypothetical protein BDA99DRAFT_562803 [Phascolomyces articulosus]
MGYIWGGEGIHSTPSFRDIISYFSAISVDTEEHTLSYAFVDNSRDYKNFSSGAAAIVDPNNNDRVLFFGGYRDSRINTSEDGLLYIEQYDFSNSQWTSITPRVIESSINSSTGISPPRNRAYASATATPSGNIYIAGGVLTNTNGTTDPVAIWLYDPILQVFEPVLFLNSLSIEGESWNHVNGFILDPKTTLTIHQQKAKFDVPDVRLCFKGGSFVNVSAICTKNTHNFMDDSCDPILDARMFNSSLYYPYSTFRSLNYDMDCWFVTSTDYIYPGFSITDLQLSYEYIPDNTTLVHMLQIDVYDPLSLNPNIITYNDDSHLLASNRQFMESEEYIDWSQGDGYTGQLATVGSNIYFLDLDDKPRFQLIVGFNSEKHFKLSHSTWNVIGIAPIYQETTGISTSFQTGFRDNETIPELGESSSIITLQLMGSGNVTIFREQRIFTLMDVLGSVGGLLAMLVAIHSLLYGGRPTSPYGVLHRFVPKKLKLSFRRAL